MVHLLICPGRENSQREFKNHGIYMVMQLLLLLLLFSSSPPFHSNSRDFWQESHLMTLTERFHAVARNSHREWVIPLYHQPTNHHPLTWNQDKWMVNMNLPTRERECERERERERSSRHRDNAPNHHFCRLSATNGRVAEKWLNFSSIILTLYFKKRCTVAANCCWALQKELFHFFTFKMYTTTSTGTE